MKNKVKGLEENNSIYRYGLDYVAIVVASLFICHFFGTALLLLIVVIVGISLMGTLGTGEL